MRARRIGSLMLCLVLAAALAACGPQTPGTADPGTSQSASDPAPAQGVVPGLSAENFPRVDGSTANLPLLAKVYSEVCGVPMEEAETKVAVSGGTGAVWRNMMYGGADLLLVYEAPENIKEEMAQDASLKLDITPLGRDGLVFLVNAANPVENLTREQLIDIYTGKITDWGQVGGTPGPIAAFQRNEESGSQTLFMKLLMEDRTPMDPPTQLRPAAMGALIDGVAQYDGSGGAIGYSVYYYAQLMYTNPDLKLLSVDGVQPTAETIGSGAYPLLNDFYVVIRSGEPEGSPARLLRDWLLSDTAAAAMKEEQYIPIQK